MAKRYLGGGVSFEQKDVYQEFSEDEGGGGGGSTTLSGLTDVDINNPTDGQTLVYNAESGKWENGAGGGGAGNVIPVITLNRTSATGGTATCNMSYGAIQEAISSGRLTVAKFVQAGDTSVLYANLCFVETNTEEASVGFHAAEILSGGNIAWHGVYLSATTIEYSINTTISYPGE